MPTTRTEIDAEKGIMLSISSAWLEHKPVNKRGMGPLLFLVFPCFRKNVVVACKIGSFLCSLDNLLQKSVIVLFFGNQISKWRSFEKRAIFDLFTFFSYQGNTYLTHIHTHMYFAHPIDFFALPIFWGKKTNLSGMVSLWCVSWC